jgi:hexosaminidase
MFRDWSFLDMRRFALSDGKHVVQPCIWTYSGAAEIFNQTIRPQSFNNLCLEFRSVWAASCFRGTYSPSQTLVDFQERLYNHKLWLDRIGSNPICKGYVQGIILTGWSRFSHESVLCELLSMSIPSIQLCLSVIEAQGLKFGMIH